MGRVTQGLPKPGICTQTLSDPMASVSPSSLCWDMSCCEEKRRSLDFPDTHLGPLSHSLGVCTLVPDAAEVGDQQDIASIPEAHFGKKSGFAKANRSPGLCQKAALQLLGALHLQESNQISASPSTQEDPCPWGGLTGTLRPCRPLHDSSPTSWPGGEDAQLALVTHILAYTCSSAGVGILGSTVQGSSYPSSQQAPQMHQQMHSNVSAASPALSSACCH